MLRELFEDIERWIADYIVWGCDVIEQKILHVAAAATIDQVGAMR